MTNNPGTFSRLDLAFAEFLANRSHLGGGKRRELFGLLAALSQDCRQGHSCRKIGTEELTILQESGLASMADNGIAESKPLVIEDDRLYLQRYWHYEQRLAAQLKELAKEYTIAEQPAELMQGYWDAHTNPQQQQAINMAIYQKFCLITGGPGTGKTTTVCKILAALQSQAADQLAIALTAPTGKAAVRLQESIAANIALLDCPDTLKRQLPQTATTLHRLLGAQPPSPYFRHHGANPLHHDVVVIDEASMVDLALMSKLVDALKPGARLILLGDKDQLISVESGSVLADMIAALPQNTVALNQSYRFTGVIGALAQAVNRQDAAAAWDLLTAQENNEIIGLLPKTQLIDYFAQQRQPYLDRLKSGRLFPELMDAFNRFQVLCANRRGALGALEINQRLEYRLFGQHDGHPQSLWYHGRPVIIVQNQPELGLANGDIGLCLNDESGDNALMVNFLQPDGSTRKYLPARLPSCETALALTVHKSQGSEFDSVLVVLPEQVNPVLSKELLYTAITRARKCVTLLADETVLTAAIEKTIERHTGLAAKLLK